MKHWADKAGIPAYIHLPLLDELSRWRKPYLLEKRGWPNSKGTHPYQSARYALQQKVKLP